jgi:serine/threonine protein kinase
LFHPKPPDQLLGEELNHGAYGVVHKGVFGDRPVAVKKIHDIRLQFEAAFSNEEIKSTITQQLKKVADMLKTVQHHNLAKYFGAYDDPKTHSPILVMELMPMDLRTFLEDNKGPGVLQVATWLNICFQICQRLQYFHSRTPPLAHLYIGYKNVLQLAEVCMVKIREYKDIEQIYSETKAPGSIPFMPPETFEFGEKFHYTKVGPFSFGHILMEVATQSEPSPSVHGIGVVPEVERRANDLKKMKDDHPLKPLILKCLGINKKIQPYIDHHDISLLKIYKVRVQN